jgi:hypothetical protein
MIVIIIIVIIIMMITDLLDINSIDATKTNLIVFDNIQDNVNLLDIITRTRRRICSIIILSQSFYRCQKHIDDDDDSLMMIDDNDDDDD